jgi:3-oxoacyl-[acyl-carrier-protein] synthase I
VSVPDRSLAILHSGLVTSVGLTTEAACAAIRASVTNHSQTRFYDSDGEWITGAQVPMDNPARGRERLLAMLELAIDECLEPYDVSQMRQTPLLLCVAEPQRAGRLDGLDTFLLSELRKRRPSLIHPGLSGVIAHGRVGAGLALSHARTLLNDHAFVLVAASDSLLLGPTLAALEANDRLLTSQNSNGFVPGEAAGALLVGRAPSAGSHLVCEGIGFAQEHAVENGDEPLRADGLTDAIRLALGDAGCELHDLDFRITDNSGEQYYFKEAALALNRILRRRKEEFDIWHPAECVGEVGAAIGPIALAVALTACRKAYSPGDRVLFHSGNDAGQRCAAVLAFRRDQG